MLLVLLSLMFPFPMSALLLFPELSEGDPRGLPLLLLLAGPLLSPKLPGADFGVVGERGPEVKRE